MIWTFGLIFCGKSQQLFFFCIQLSCSVQCSETPLCWIPFENWSFGGWLNNPKNNYSISKNKTKILHECVPLVSISVFIKEKKSEALTICLQECVCERAHIVRVVDGIYSEDQWVKIWHFTYSCNLQQLFVQVRVPRMGWKLRLSSLNVSTWAWWPESEISARCCSAYTELSASQCRHLELLEKVAVLFMFYAGISHSWWGADVACSAWLCAAVNASLSLYIFSSSLQLWHPTPCWSSQQVAAGQSVVFTAISATSTFLNRVLLLIKYAN